MIGNDIDKTECLPSVIRTSSPLFLDKGNLKNEKRKVFELVEF